MHAISLSLTDKWRGRSKVGQIRKIEFGRLKKQKWLSRFDYKVLYYYHFPEGCCWTHIAPSSFEHGLAHSTCHLLPCNASNPLHSLLHYTNMLTISSVFSALNHSLNELATSLRFYEFFCFSGFHFHTWIWLEVCRITSGLAFSLFYRQRRFLNHLYDSVMLLP